jgi:hypothetical protein
MILNIILVGHKRRFYMIKKHEYVIVFFEDNWADEMDINGFCVMSKKEYDKMIDEINGINFENELEVYIGTNESIEYTDAQSVLRCLKTKPVTKEEYDVLKKFFKQSYSKYIGFGEWVVDRIIERGYDC